MVVRLDSVPIAIGIAEPHQPKGESTSPLVVYRYRYDAKFALYNTGPKNGVVKNCHMEEVDSDEVRYENQMATYIFCSFLLIIAPIIATTL